MQGHRHKVPSKFFFFAVYFKNTMQWPSEHHGRFYLIAGTLLYVGAFDPPEGTLVPSGSVITCCGENNYIF